jgi:hypothetical protein
MSFLKPTTAYHKLVDARDIANYSENTDDFFDILESKVFEFVWKKLGDRDDFSVDELYKAIESYVQIHMLKCKTCKMQSVYLSQKVITKHTYQMNGKDKDGKWNKGSYYSGKTCKTVISAYAVAEIFFM